MEAEEQFMDFEEARGIVRKNAQLQKHFVKAEAALIAAQEARAFCERTEISKKGLIEEIASLEEKVIKATERERTASAKSDEAVKKETIILTARIADIQADANNKKEVIRSETVKLVEDFKENKIAIEQEINELEMRRAAAKKACDGAEVEMNHLRERLSQVGVSLT